jgi:hypothetical protein
MNSEVFMKSSIFWDKTPCSPLKVKRRFGGICRLHLYGRKTLGLPPVIHWLLRCRSWRQNIRPKLRLTFGGIHDGISQKMELFITTAARTWNSAKVAILIILKAVVRIVRFKSKLWHDSLVKFFSAEFNQNQLIRLRVLSSVQTDRQTDRAVLIGVEQGCEGAYYEWCFSLHSLFWYGSFCWNKKSILHMSASNLFYAHFMNLNLVFISTFCKVSFNFWYSLRKL